MSDETPTDKPRRTRRPLSLSDKLVELRAQKRAALAKLVERESKIRSELASVRAQASDVEAELARLQLAIGEARDNERPDSDGDAAAYYAK